LINFPDTIAVVLAAGKGKRMKSSLPKVMHKLHGKPIIRYVTKTLTDCGFAGIVIVVGIGRELIYEEFEGDRIDFAVQEQQLGTGDAVKAARGYFAEFNGHVLVTLGDVPLLRSQSLQNLVSEHRSSGAAVTVLSAVLDDPSGYGRIVRGENGQVKRIVEHADANDEEKRIREINTGIIVFEASALRNALERIDCDNAQGEYYLTDAVKILLSDGEQAGAVTLGDHREGLGINSVDQLQAVSELMAEIKNVDKELGES
jgi:bifunctional UDP-N-acetylglucosamine pyrophosphorylase/glucosamine-1-phosphate N-acetyltransferase